MARGISRRRLMTRGAGGLLAVGALAGCDALSTTPERAGDGAESGERANEAPTLRRMVSGGDLRPLSERLPVDPVVIEPVDRLGAYGGTWRTALQGSADTSWLFRTVGRENLVAWRDSTEWTGSRADVIPNVASAWGVNDTATEYTFTIRRGIRWSDGEPFTVADIVFAQNEVLGNQELYPVPPIPGTAEAIDDDTVRITLDDPNGLFLQDLTQGSASPLTATPAHYLRQFHSDHAEGLDALIHEAGLEDWVQLFLAKMDQWSNTDLPVLSAWMASTALGDGDRVVLDRNPYYWKTDTEGRQLPYIDGIEYDIVGELETLTLKATSGEIDFHTRHINTLQNKPVLARAREDAGFDFVRLISSAPSNAMLIMFNLTHQDPAKREVFQNLDFRTGLSHAINRQEIIEATLQAQGEPAQHGPRPESRFYNERLFDQFVDYDVAAANEHLDRTGYVDRDDDGIRLGPDRNPIRFSVDVTEIFGQPWVEMLELVRQYWEDVGVGINILSMDRSLHNARTAANEHDAQVWEGQGGLDVLIRPGDFVPIHPGQARYAPLWADWYRSEGETGEEPPPRVRRQLEIYDELRRSPSEETQAELLTEILEIATEQFYSIGVSVQPESYGIVKSSFRNVPPVLVESFLYNTPAASNPCHYFIDEDL